MEKMFSEKYKFGFDIWGAVLFLAIMIPNFIWFAVPAPNDVLRCDSVTQILDLIASVCQVLMTAALCVIINKKRRKISFTPLIIAAVICCLLYYANWVIYYNGVVNMIVILGLTVPPCLAFLFFAVDRKNMIAVVPIAIFTVCHLIYAVANFFFD